MKMDFKRIMPLFIVFIMVGALIGIPAASAATSHIALCNSNGNEVSTFNSTKSDDPLKMYARLYVDGEWKALRYLEFDLYDSTGKHLIHYYYYTSFITGYARIFLWNNEFSTRKTGDYQVVVSYKGNNDNGWPKTSTTAVIHRT
jgi:hypothetical protein